MSDIIMDDIQEALLETFREESFELLSELETSLLELEDSPDDEELINRAFRALHTIKGNSAIFGFDSIGSLTHSIESVFDMVRKKHIKVDREIIDMTLKARDVIQQMLRIKDGEPDQEECSILISLFSDMVEERKKTCSREANAKGSAKNDETGEQKTGESNTEGQTGPSIRVASGKLDKLVDLVGEMVTVQAQLTQMVSERSDAFLAAVAEKIESLTGELRENAFSIRMVPIGTAYRRIRRLVRDLSRELDQDVELVTEGAETELDKNVIEKLTDPLMHIIRNSVDHGIEKAEERVENGKPAKGTVRIEAGNSGANVVIRIQDDGRGLDTEAIRNRAVERGLVSRDTELTDTEIFSLIFSPGFSTANEVTSVSGRGVGLDVVRKSIEAMRGSVDIESVPGKGTTFIIYLPLTLAIIEGLLVLVGGEKYILPLSIVEECVFLSKADREKSHGRDIVQLRGEIVPYICMRNWFNVGTEPPDIQQVVVFREEGRRAGLLVDHVIGEHQTVIKSLGRVYRNVDGVSGATILGDGTISLILDVRRIMSVTEEIQFTAPAA
jgi:two-component system chemotaxis sensor kinase CheA